MSKHEKILELAEKAKKLKPEDYDGPVYCDSIGYNDGYFEDLSALEDYCSDEDILSPGPIFGCHVHMKQGAESWEPDYSCCIVWSPDAEEEG